MMKSTVKRKLAHDVRLSKCCGDTKLIRESAHTLKSMAEDQLRDFFGIWKMNEYPVGNVLFVMENIRSLVGKTSDGQEKIRYLRAIDRIKIDGRAEEGDALLSSE